MRLLDRLQFMSAWEAKREYKKSRQKSLDEFIIVFNRLVKESIKHGCRYITLHKPDILTVRDFEILLKELGYSIETRNLGTYRVSFKDKIEKQVQIVKLK